MKKVYASSMMAVVIGALSSGLIVVAPTWAKDAPASATKTSEKKTIDVSITKLSSPVKPGDDATCAIKTEPNALCKIEVKLKSGASKAAALKAQRADDKGVTTWNWKTAPNAAVGDWPVTVDCSSKGAKGSASGTLKIAK
jgi:hypothetical protein